MTSIQQSANLTLEVQMSYFFCNHAKGKIERHVKNIILEDFHGSRSAIIITTLLPYMFEKMRQNKYCTVQEKCSVREGGTSQDKPSQYISYHCDQTTLFRAGVGQL